ncbi:MAG: exodeoxyribonuclease V subunit gamma, partial [SAR324 cluster bacterium]|nr:exodeoxyribonuclease V subunit gamma [SAR324 cluster bacterium]
ALQSLVVKPLSTPLTQEFIIVQNKPMADWLTMELCKSLGVWSGQSFPFPKKVITQFMQMVLGEQVAETRAFDPENLFFEILIELDDLKNEADFMSIKDYISGNQLRFWRFALALANLYDQYLVFRRDWILQWDQGDFSKIPLEHRWQGVLWQKISAKKGFKHIAQLSISFAEELKKNQNKIKDFERISIFGLSSLPPLYLEFFGLIGEITEVNLFQLCPSNLYWADIKKKKDIFKLLRKSKKDITEEHLHLDLGNPLLASFGDVGKAYQANIESLIAYQEADLDLFEEPNDHSLLGQIQRDIYNLELPAANSRDFTLLELNFNINACPNAFREVEVLKDQILLAIQVEGVSPENILVMAPEMSTYEPIFKEVFSKEARIPFAFADSSPLAENKVFEIYFSFAALNRDRFTLTNFLNLLGTKEVMESIDLNKGELALVKGWLQKSGARWATDEEERLDLSLPQEGHNSFFEAFSRLIVGFAFPNTHSESFEGVYPTGIYEGLNSLTLGKVIDFFERVKSHYNLLKVKHSLLEWKELATNVVQNLVSEDTLEDSELFEFYTLLEKISEEAKASDFTEIIPLDCFIALIKERLEAENPGKSYGAYGVTCASLRPMRSIPFDVIYLIGLNEKEFPRQSSPSGFNLMELWPQLGDRSLLEDDRYLFLESLISARKSFAISYIYKRPKDNKTKPPSTLVTELIDYVKDAYGLEELPEEPEVGPYQSGLTFFHAERAFDPIYFDSNQPLSFATSELEALKALNHYPKVSDSFLPLPIEGELVQGEDWELKDLISTLIHPAQALLQRTLGIKFSFQEKPLENREPQELDDLEKWKIGDEILQKMTKGQDYRRDDLVKTGHFPPAAWGQIALDEISAKTDPLLAEIKENFPVDSAQPNLAFNLNINNLQIKGNLEQLFDGGLLDFSYSDFKAKALLEAWVRHLVLCALRPKDVSIKSTYICKHSKNGFESYQFSEPIEAKSELKKLVKLAQSFLVYPEPFFVEVSYKYASAFLAKGDRQDAIKKAFGKWKEDGHQSDLYYQRFFSDL